MVVHLYEESEMITVGFDSVRITEAVNETQAVLKKTEKQIRA